MKKHITILLSTLLLMAMTISLYSFMEMDRGSIAINPRPTSHEITSICRFLEGLYIDFGDGTGCLRESPNVEKDRCYTNTNFITLAVLRMCNSSIVPRIEAFLDKYDNQYGGRFEVMLLHDIPYPPRAVQRLELDKKTVNNETITIYADIPSNTTLPDWDRYADMLMLAALQLLKNGDIEKAREYIEEVKKIWSGRGFVDKAYNATGVYDTYKLSLYYFISKAIGEKDDIAIWIENNIHRFIKNGGVITNYDNDLNPAGDPNIETTAVTAIALYTNYSNAFQLYKKKQTLPSIDIAIPVAICTTIVAILVIIILIYKKKQNNEHYSQSRAGRQQFQYIVYLYK